MQLPDGATPPVELLSLDSFDAMTPGPAGPTVHSVATTVLIEPAEALKTEEAEQVRRIARAALLVAGLTLVLTPFVGGDAVMIQYAGLLVALVACGILWRRSLDPSEFGGPWVFIGWLLATVSACANATYLGVQSGALVITMIPLYFSALGRNRWTGWLCYGLAATYMLALFTATWFGLVPDIGMIRVQTDNAAIAVGLHCMIQIVLLATVIFARSVRQAREAAIDKLHAAAISALKRNAAAAEAHAQLARVQPRGLGQLTGTTVGEFTLDEQIGRGGMAEVYAAIHETTGVRAAVKVLLPSVESDGQMVRRFLREVEVVERLRSPHIVELLGSGTHDGRPYLAMELLEGHDLATELRTRKSLRMAEVLRMVTDVGRGIDAAAKAEVVHRDIKPQNIFAVPRGDKTIWKILDFGISRLSQPGHTMTRDHILGTPQYMAPEQVRGQDVGPRADVYGLAASAYRALTGVPVSDATNVSTQLFDAVHRMPRRPSTLVRCHPDVDLAFAVGLCKSPDDRFVSGAEFARALAAAARGELDPKLRARAHAVLSTLDWRR